MAPVAQAAGHAQAMGHNGHDHRSCFAMVTMAMAIAVAVGAVVAMAPCVRYLGARPCVAGYGSYGHMYHPFFINARPTRWRWRCSYTVIYTTIYFSNIVHDHLNHTVHCPPNPRLHA